jgi:hypothetical protein
MATYPPTLNPLPAIFNPNEFYKEETGVDNLTDVLIEGNDAGANQIDMNNNKIVDCANPTNNQDVATKLYVDSQGVNTLVAGNNITIISNPTTDPVVGVKSPLDATLFIGNQLIDGGSVDLTGDKTATLGIQTTNGVLSSINLSYSEPTTSTTNAFTLQTQDTQVVETMSVADATATRTKTETLAIGSYDENIQFTASKFAIRNMSDTSAGSGITFGDGSTFLNTAQDIVNSAGVSKTINYQDAGATKIVSTNQQVSSSQNLNTFYYQDNGAGGLQTYSQTEANGTYARTRLNYTPTTAGQPNLTTLSSNSAGCSLRHDIGISPTSFSEISTGSANCTISHNVGSSLLQINTATNSSSINQTADNSGSGGSVSYQQNVGTTAFSINSLSASGTAITCSANPLSVNSGSFITNTSGRVGAVSQPSFVFDSANATAGSYPAIKIDRSAGNYSAGETLGSISMWGKDSAGTSREWSRLQTKTENVGGSNQDGTLSILNSVNGVMLETFNFNGGQNEINSFRPLDMNGNNIRTTSGNLTIETSNSTGPGLLTLSALQSININSGGGSNIALTTSGGNFTLNTGATGGVQLTGTALTSGSASGNSGQHLVITINGTPYKIQLLNP